MPLPEHAVFGMFTYAYSVLVLSSFQLLSGSLEAVDMGEMDSLEMAQSTVSDRVRF